MEQLKTFREAEHWYQSRVLESVLKKDSAYCCHPHLYGRGRCRWNVQNCYDTKHVWGNRVAAEGSSDAAVGWCGRRGVTILIVGKTNQPSQSIFNPPTVALINNPFSDSLEDNPTTGKSLWN